MQRSYIPDMPLILYRPNVLPPGFLAVEFQLWIPSDHPVQAVLGISPYATGGLFKDPCWRELATRRNCALLVYDIRKTAFPDGVTHMAPDADGFSVFQEGLEALAHRSGLANLGSLPVSFAGLSKSAEQALHYADFAGDRALGVVAFHMPVGLKPHETVLSRLAAVPVLCPFAEHDRFFVPELMAHQLAFVHSSESPPHPWAGVFRAGLEHHEPGHQAFITAWLEEILRLRLPPDSSRCLPLRMETGWHGDLQLHVDRVPEAPDQVQSSTRTIEFRPATQPPLPPPHRRHWLPSEAIARAWKHSCLTASVRDAQPPSAGLPNDHDPAS